ncbi:Signal recognition particle 54 kDa protein, chloroplastic [Dendrobium catenatum]|uniref:Signal recognition particle 54 kDa protein, chloroplastic n=1 Tax=Dendrobium catenatum TaxID=906689 RepID=A0A2I0VIV5_9ASPA|nr:Signal recognition particle 54 kDa protein, chloroplastic [Dendrobium catenatum]
MRARRFMRWVPLLDQPRISHAVKRSFEGGNRWIPVPKMLEQLLIFTRGGLILWTCKELGNALRGSPIDALIRSCLLEERSADAAFNYDAPGAAAYTLKWTFHNDLGLVAPLLGKKQVQSAAQRGAHQGGGKQRSGGNSDSVNDEDDDDSEKRHGLVNNGSSGHQNGIKLRAPSTIKGKENGLPGSGAFDVNKLQKLRAKGAKKNAAGGASKASKEEPKKNVKKNRVWDDSPSESKLDFTDPGDERGDGVLEVVAADQGESMMDKEEIVSSESEDDDGDEFKSAKASVKKKSWFSSMFQSISGNAVLEKSDLQPALKALKDRLMTKNVAEEIAEKLCESIAASLEGKKLGSFTRISSTVQAAMEEALLRILTPKRSVDILRDVHAAKEQGKPYVIVFVGVNGVGKSTNLAKIPIFEKGYEKDPAIVAKEAIQEASRNNSDVVLVDTAGRMQKLADFSATPTARLIDGILLTKFDTIDDKHVFNFLSALIRILSFSGIHLRCILAFRGDREIHDKV